MRTDQLIRALAADPAPPARPVALNLALALAAAFAVSALLFQATLGARPDIAAAAGTPRFLLKFVEAILLFAAALVLVLRLCTPGAPTRGVTIALFAAPALLALAVVFELYLLPADIWGKTLFGSNAITCLRSISLLALAPLTGALFVLRHGAPTRPALAGAIAGLLAGGMGAALYAAHCIDDSPLFVATWYTIAILPVTALGAAIGSRVLRW